MTEEFESKPTRVLHKREKAILAVLAILPAVASSIGSAVVAYRTARTDAQVAAAEAKSKAEKATAVVDDKVRAGYEVTRVDVEALKARVIRLERALRAAKMTVKSPPAPTPAPLPATVEKAVEAVKQ